MITLTAKIYITDEEPLELDYRVLKSLQREEKERSDLKLPSFGIISNHSNTSFKDPYGKIKQLANNLQLIGGQKVEIFLNNTLTGGSQKIGELYTDQWNYDPYEGSVNLSLKDNIEEWQNIHVERLNYDPRYPEHKSFKYIYNYLREETPSKFKMLTFERLDSKTKEQLENSWLVYPFLEEDNLWREWDKFAVATQCQIFQQNGITVCRYVGGN